MTGNCPKVQKKIEEVERRNKAGLCWCPCIKDDLPSAKKKLKAKNCGGANAVIQAALARCFKNQAEKDEANSYEPLEW